MERRLILFGLALLLVGRCAPLLYAQGVNPVQYFYDGLGRLTCVVDTSGNIATCHYEASIKGWRW